MTPQEVLGRVITRLREERELVVSSAEELLPERHKDAVDALHETERLLNAQINRLNRVRRRYEL